MGAALKLIDQAVYAYSSFVSANTLHLSIAQKEDVELPYFKGAFLQPHMAARCLLVLSKVVRARFHTPPAMLQRILRESDPVITCNGEDIVFEGFSACCSTYCKVMFQPEAFTDPECGNGTTNVDFGEKMRAALAKVRCDDSLLLEVGIRGFAIEGSTGDVVERKIPLPHRWIKSFNAVQSYLSEMELFAELNRAEALRFLRSIPRQPTPRAIYYLGKAGRGLRLSQVKSSGTMELKAVERLRLLEELVPLSDSLRIYTNPDQSASCWSLTIQSMNFSVCISADAWRGFSGEGRGLEQLVTSVSEEQMVKMKAALHWDKHITVAGFSNQWAVVPADAKRILNQFAQRGMLGYDLTHQHYFYRRLPYDLRSIEQLQPRIKKAQQLVDCGAVDFEQKDSLATAAVEDGKNRHQVFVNDETARCTCTWYAKHKNDRGPCSHILAVQMRLDA